MSTSTPVAAGPERRRQASLGGLIPTSAVAREGDTLVVVLCVEVHAEGAVLPVLVLSDAPGLLGWDPTQGLTVRDDSGREYEVQNLAQQAGLGALQTAVWISPAPPPDARRLVLEVGGLVRTAVARGTSVERPLVGAVWSLELDLVPPRTAVDVPDEPTSDAAPGRPARVPARTFGGFRDLVPIGQARVVNGAAVCLWALERYADRAVLSVGALAEDPLRVAPLTPGVGRVDVWDDLGRRYEVSPIHGASRPGWSETSLEVSPAIDAEASVLGVRLADLPGHGPSPEHGDVLAGPFTFGIAVPPGHDVIPRADGPAWVILPTYDEAENVVAMIEAVLAVADGSGIEMRVLVVDDDSPDGTAGLAEGVAARDPRVAVLRRAAKEGIGPAYRAGFRRALDEGAGVVVEMDCDFSHDPARLPALIEASATADLVIGSRYVRGGGVARWGPVRRAVSRGGCLYAQAILGVGVRDLTGGFKCFRREVLEAIPLDDVTAAGYGFQIEMTYRAMVLGFRVVEIPIVFTERLHGRSKMSRGIVWEAAVLVPRLRRLGRPFLVVDEVVADGAEAVS